MGWQSSNETKCISSYYTVVVINKIKNCFSGIALKSINIQWIRNGFQPYWKIIHSFILRQFSTNIYTIITTIQLQKKTVIIYLFFGRSYTAPIPTSTVLLKNMVDNRRGVGIKHNIIELVEYLPLFICQDLIINFIILPINIGRRANLLGAVGGHFI